ncbi:MAG: hypothetical protein WAM60_11010 [Candidatus Promineifilaceae bacterium]
MYPEDRVLVAYVPSPADFTIIREEGWYRIPQRHMPKGLYAEYFAFYFGRKFGPEKWAIHYYAPQRGYELLTRRDLLPDQPDHPRGDDLYYKVQLGPLQKLERPIISLRWRRITFIHTTWDRFQDAQEINDLYVEGGDYVDRLYAILKERGIYSERNYRVKEGGEYYQIPLAIFCRSGRLDIRDPAVPQDDSAVINMADEISREVQKRGGLADI